MMMEVGIYLSGKERGVENGSGNSSDDFGMLMLSVFSDSFSLCRVFLRNRKAGDVRLIGHSSCADHATAPLLVQASSA